MGMWASIYNIHTPSTRCSKNCGAAIGSCSLSWRTRVGNLNESNMYQVELVSVKRAASEYEFRFKANQLTKLYHSELSDLIDVADTSFLDTNFH